MSLMASPEWTRENDRRERKRLEADSARLDWLKKQLRDRGISVSLRGYDPKKWKVGPLHGA